jgi:hypothetical protein
MLGGPVTLFDFALQGTVEVVVVLEVVVVEVLDVVVVELDVVVVPPPLVVVVVVPPPPPPKLIGASTWVPPCVPKAMAQVSPAVTWAAVGGQG